MIVSLAQTSIYWEDKEKNIEKLRQIVKEQKDNGSEYVFFPEMSLTGFSMNTKLTSEEGYETEKRLASIASQYEIGIGFGWVKDCGNKCRNYYSIVDKKGGVIYRYAKIHPFSYSEEDKWFIGGNEICIYSLDDIDISVFICYDLRFPEIFRSIAGKVKAVIIPANWPKKRANHWKTLLQARAIENQIYIFGVNCVGRIGGVDYSGDSCVINPNGDIIEMISNIESVIRYEFHDDVSDFRDSFPVLCDIRKDVTISVK